MIYFSLKILKDLKCLILILTTITVSENMGHFHFTPTDKHLRYLTQLNAHLSINRLSISIH